MRALLLLLAATAWASTESADADISDAHLRRRHRKGARALGLNANAAWRHGDGEGDAVAAPGAVYTYALDAKLSLQKNGRTGATRASFCDYVVSRFLIEVKDATAEKKADFALKKDLEAPGVDSCVKMAAYRCNKWAPSDAWKAASCKDIYANLLVYTTGIELNVLLGDFHSAVRWFKAPLGVNGFDAERANEYYVLPDAGSRSTALSQYFLALISGPFPTEAASELPWEMVWPELKPDALTNTWRSQKSLERAKVLRSVVLYMIADDRIHLIHKLLDTCDPVKDELKLNRIAGVSIDFPLDSSALSPLVRILRIAACSSPPSPSSSRSLCALLTFCSGLHGPDVRLRCYRGISAKGRGSWRHTSC